MKKFDLGSTAPYGFCDECLRRMQAGAEYQLRDLPGGRQLASAYCEHRQAGAVLLVRESGPLRWTITQPIDILDWVEFLKLKARALEGFAAELGEPVLASSPAHVAEKEIMQ